MLHSRHQAFPRALCIYIFTHTEYNSYYNIMSGIDYSKWDKFGLSDDDDDDEDDRVASSSSNDSHVQNVLQI